MTKQLRARDEVYERYQDRWVVSRYNFKLVEMAQGEQHRVGQRGHHCGLEALEGGIARGEEEALKWVLGLAPVSPMSEAVGVAMTPEAVAGELELAFAAVRSVPEGTSGLSTDDPVEDIVATSRLDGIVMGLRFALVDQPDLSDDRSWERFL